MTCGGGGGAGGLEESEEYSLDYRGMAKFTQESLLSPDLLKKSAMPAQSAASKAKPPACHMLTGMPSLPTFTADYYD